MKKTILVIGATGAQGGSVASHLIMHKNFKVRCFTRNINSDSAKKLRVCGAELFDGDLADKNSLLDAMENCYGVFGVTNYWEHFDKELEHGKNLVDAVGETNIEHFVLSALPSADKLSKGELEVPHFELKAKIEEYCRSKRIPATYLHVAFYFENFLSYFPPTKMEDGSFGFGFPQGDTPLATVSVGDLGGIVNTIFNNPQEYIGKLIGAVSEDLRPEEYAELMTRVLGKTVKYNYIPREQFASLGFPGAEDLANMFTLNRLHILERKSDQKLSRIMYPEIKSFEQWLKVNKEKFAKILQ